MANNNIEYDLTGLKNRLQDSIRVMPYASQMVHALARELGNTLPNNDTPEKVYMKGASIIFEYSIGKGRGTVGAFLSRKTNEEYEQLRKQLPAIIAAASTDKSFKERIARVSGKDISAIVLIDETPELIKEYNKRN
jgi:hypothetical protein